MTEPVEGTDARAGVISGRVRNVLFGSLGLAAVAFVVLYLWFTLST